MVDKQNNRGLFLTFSATLLAFVVVVMGAYTRLTDAGLGCPDWPGCYGQLIPKEHISNVLINTTKAWTEMIHRYFAGALGIIIFILNFFMIKHKAVFKKQSLLLACAISVLVIFQALLGMWTVTLKLFPVVVMAHLLGGFTTLSLLWWLALTLKPLQISQQNTDPQLRRWSVIGLVMLIIQIFLGGWTSANYAALVCLDFPFCQDFTDNNTLNLLDVFNFTAVGVDGSQGTPLNHAARVTIHMLHRMGALLTTLIIGWLAMLTLKHQSKTLIRNIGLVMVGLLILQILLGITNILAILPLPVAVAHNAVAALLLLSLVTLNYFIYAK